MALKSDPEVEDEGEQEGDRIDLALPLDEAALPRELPDEGGRERLDHRLLHIGETEIVGEGGLPSVAAGQSRSGLTGRQHRGRVAPPRYA